MTSLIDTHAHLHDEALDAQINEVLQRAASAGLVQILTVGTTLQTSRRACELADQHPLLYAAVGIHPTHVHEAEPGDWEQILKLVKHPRVRAIGETGLDNYWKEAPLDLQQDYFARHLQLSRQTGHPFIVHMRESSEEILVMLREEAKRGPLHGVMHSFTGDWQLAQTCLDLGMYLSFAGMVTFKNGADLRAVAKRVPADRILVETDCPYLSPEPFRGKRPNEPARVQFTAKLLAETRGVPYAEFCKQTTENARRLFGIT